MHWFGWDFFIDDLGHKIHLPRFIQRRLCEWFDRRLGWRPLDPDDDDDVGMV